MSAHSTLYSSTGLAALFAQHADSSRVRYVAPSGVEIATDAVIGEETIEEVSDGDGRVNLRTRRVQIRTTDVVEPRVNAVCLVDGVEYAVRDVQAAGDGFALLTLGRSPVAEQSRPNYRPTMRDPRRR